jgi:hypothetical protein
MIRNQEMQMEGFAQEIYRQRRNAEMKQICKKRTKREKREENIYGPVNVDEKHHVLQRAGKGKKINDRI